jgi:uncharacterized protein
MRAKASNRASSINQKNADSGVFPPAASCRSGQDGLVLPVVMHGVPSAREAVASLCPACGICCNGVLFKDVELQPSDDAARLRGLGLGLKRRKPSSAAARAGASAEARFPRLVFTQPCRAFGADDRCEIYSDRPSHCRHFDCALLMAVDAGTVAVPAARRTIRRVLELAEEVRRLLRELGDNQETLALDLRFQGLARALCAAGLDDRQAVLYGRLTLQMHDFNMLLRQAFYPRPGD